MPLAKNYKIRVTAKNIKQGKRQEAISCPIAKAFSKKRITISFVPHDVEVGSNSIDFMSPLGAHSLKLPKGAQQFITRFDSGKLVKPFEFTIPACFAH